MEGKTLKVIFYDQGINKGTKIYLFQNLYMIDMPLDNNNQIILNKINLIENSGIYFLIDDENNNIYIGKSTNLKNRFMTHKSNNKEFNINKIYYFVSENKFDYTEIDYLEYYFINFWKEESDNLIYSITNKSLRNIEPYINDFTKSDILIVIEKIKIYLRFLGIIIPKIIKSKKNEEKDQIVNNESISIEENQDVFNFKKAELIYSQGNFILLKNSIISSYEKTIKSIINVADKYKDKTIKIVDGLYNRVNDKIEKIDDDEYMIIENIIFKSPSPIACLANGTASYNGWTAFKNNNNKTLDDVYRKLFNNDDETQL